MRYQPTLPNLANTQIDARAWVEIEYITYVETTQTIMKIAERTEFRDYGMRFNRKISEPAKNFVRDSQHAYGWDKNAPTGYLYCEEGVLEILNAAGPDIKPQSCVGTTGEHTYPVAQLKNVLVGYFSGEEKVIDKEEFKKVCILATLMPVTLMKSGEKNIKKGMTNKAKDPNLPFQRYVDGVKIVRCDKTIIDPNFYCLKDHFEFLRSEKSHLAGLLGQWKIDEKFIEDHLSKYTLPQIALKPCR